MEEKNYKEEYENILKVAKEELLKCKQHKCDQEGNSFAEKEYFIYKMFPLLKGSDMLKDEIIGGLMWQRDQYAKCGSEKSSAVLPGFTVPVNTLIDFLEKSKIVEQDSEDESEKELKEFNIGPTMDEYEACMLRYLQTAANKKDDEEIIAATKEYKEKLLKLQPNSPNKKEVWSDEIINRAIKEVGLTQYQIEWFKKNVFPPVEKGWSEEDDKIKNELYEFLEEVWYKGTNALDKYGKADCSDWMNWVDTLSDKIKRTTHNKWLEFKEQHIKELKEAEEKGYQDGVKDGMEIERKDKEVIEWSEEDKNRFNNLCRIIRKAEGWNEVSKNAFITWLKENLFQSKQKWSEEDSMILTEVTSIILGDVNRANSKEEEKHLEYLASKLQSLYSKPKKM